MKKRYANSMDIVLLIRQKLTQNLIASDDFYISHVLYLAQRAFKIPLNQFMFWYSYYMINIGIDKPICAEMDEILKKLEKEPNKQVDESELIIQQDLLDAINKICSYIRGKSRDEIINLSLNPRKARQLIQQSSILSIK